MIMALGSRSPCGERGLKSPLVRPCGITIPSLPVRGAWVEMLLFCACTTKVKSRSPCGERGLKFMAAARGTDEVVAPRAGSVG